LFDIQTRGQQSDTWQLNASETGIGLEKAPEIAQYCTTPGEMVFYIFDISLKDTIKI
jgi:hypothetical protein